MCDLWYGNCGFFFDFETITTEDLPSEKSFAAGISGLAGVGQRGNPRGADDYGFT
jgi:hypothetical protein